MYMRNNTGKKKKMNKEKVNNVHSAEWGGRQKKWKWGTLRFHY